MQRQFLSIEEVGTKEISVREVVNKLCLVGGQGFRKCNCSKSVPRRCVGANQPIYFVTQNVTTVNLAVTSEFNYDLFNCEKYRV